MNEVKSLDAIDPWTPFREFLELKKRNKLLSNKLLRSHYLQKYICRLFILVNGVVAQLVERLLRMHEVEGSKPSSSIFYSHTGRTIRQPSKMQYLFSVDFKSTKRSLSKCFTFFHKNRSTEAAIAFAKLLFRIRIALMLNFQLETHRYCVEP